MLLRWSLIFLVIAIISALFGFAGLAAGAAYFAKIIFFVALAVLVVNLIIGLSRRT